MLQSWRMHRVLVLLLSFALSAVSCGSGASVLDSAINGNTAVAFGTPEAPGGAAGLAAVEGSVSISGSSTVEPISIRVAELFEAVAPGVVVDVDGPGTGDGFKLFCAGETDVSDASREIKPAEAAACAEAGIEFTELQVGIDGIAVMVNETSPVECLSFTDLYSLIGPESVGFEQWSDADALAVELGGVGGFPDLGLDLTAPGEESGTYDSLFEIVIEDVAEARAEAGFISEEEAKRTRPDYSSSADDNVILQNIQGSPSGLGWVGFAFAANATGVRLVDIAEESDGACVPANEETIASGEYPISRGLYIYVNNAKAAANPALSAYIDYYVNEGLETAVPAVGYVTLGGDALSETRAHWS